jgi:hypothetical protein
MDNDFEMDEDGRLDLFGSAGGVEGAADGSPWDAEVAGGEPGQHPYPWEDCGDDEEAWLRSMPADLRAEVLARPPLPPARPGASPLERVGGAAAFAGGGFCDTMLPGSWLGEMLAEAGRGGYRGLSDDVLTGMLRGWGRQAAHSQSELAGLVAEIARRRVEQARRPGWSRVAEHVADEVAAELTLTGRSAARLLDVAHGLSRLPAVSDALLGGFLDWPRACLFVDELAVLDDAAARQVADQLTDPAVGWTTGQLRAALARAVLAVDPAAAERRKKQARTDTRVELWHEPSGNAALAGRELRPASAITLDRKLTSDADWLSACGVPGTRDELRALAYTTLLSGRDLAAILDDPACWPVEPGDVQEGPSVRGASDGDDAPDAAGARDAATREDARNPGEGANAKDGAGAGPRLAARGQSAPTAGSVHLTMPLSAWLGSGEPGEVPGYGPVDASTSRELADLLSRDPATMWCLTVTSADGRALGHACARRGPPAGEPVISWAAELRKRLQVLEVGTCGHAHRSGCYVPPRPLRHIVQIRQRRCSFPGCRRPARQCDLDHTVPFENGGMTCECNLAPLCRRHHRAKQTPGWQLTQHQPGVMTWRLPDGRAYTTTGDPYSL